MSIKIHIELKVKEERRDDVQPLFAKLLVETRARNGNEGVTVYADQDSPTTIILIEQWSSRTLYEEYNRWRSERGDLSRLAGLLQVPPQRRFFDFLAV